MDAINWVLIHGASAVLDLWEWVKVPVGWMFSALSRILNPILSPTLSLVNPLCTAIGDAVYAGLDRLPIWLGLTVLSIMAGVVMLIAFRYTSNQPAIVRAKDDITANLLALKLYKDDLRVMFRTQVRLLWAILRLQRYVLTPVALMSLPMVLGLGQMGLRYQWRPLRPGETALIRMSLSPEAANTEDVTLDPNPGVIIEVGPIPGDGVLVWRVRGGEPGRHVLRFRAAGGVLEKEFVVERAFKRVSAIRPGREWTDQLFHPAEHPLPPGSPAESIEIQYPSVRSWIYGADYWVVYFFVISLVAAISLKPVFNVRF